MIRPTELERAAQVKRAQDLYPALFQRVRELCDGAASDVDADHHAACVVLSVKKGGK